jgi:hypothetical protein
LERGREPRARPSKYRAGGSKVPQTPHRKYPTRHSKGLYRRAAAGVVNVCRGGMDALPADLQWQDIGARVAQPSAGDQAGLRAAVRPSRAVEDGQRKGDLVAPESGRAPPTTIETIVELDAMRALPIFQPMDRAALDDVAAGQPRKGRRAHGLDAALKSQENEATGPDGPAERTGLDGKATVQWWTIEGRRAARRAGEKDPPVMLFADDRPGRSRWGHHSSP